jgi:hypothetical protein
MVTLTGMANPGQKVDFKTGFQVDLPVNSGMYEYVVNGVDYPLRHERIHLLAIICGGRDRWTSTAIAGRPPQLVFYNRPVDMQLARSDPLMFLDAFRL